MRVAKFVTQRPSRELERRPATSRYDRYVRHSPPVVSQHTMAGLKVFNLNDC